MIGKGFQIIKFERNAVKFTPNLFYFKPELLDLTLDLSDETEIVTVNDGERRQQLVNVHIILRRVVRGGVTLALNLSTRDRKLLNIIECCSIAFAYLF